MFNLAKQVVADFLDISTSAGLTVNNQVAVARRLGPLVIIPRYVDPCYVGYATEFRGGWGVFTRLFSFGRNLDTTGLFLVLGRGTSQPLLDL